MEVKQKLIYLNLIIKKNLIRVMHSWKLHTSVSQLLKKYQKLKNYTSKIVKCRQVPEIRILTTKNQEEMRSRKSSNERSGFSSTKSGLSNKTLIYRSSSSHKNQSKRPPVPVPKHSEMENVSNNSTQVLSCQSKNQDPIRKVQTLNLRNSDEVAVVSSNLTISGLSLKRFDENSETYFKIR